VGLKFGFTAIYTQYKLYFPAFIFNKNTGFVFGVCNRFEILLPKQSTYIQT